jgi:GNAT superfamily N-acetyltransferase
MRLSLDCRQVLEIVPDMPQFLETRAMLLEHTRCTVRGRNRSDCVVWQPETRLMTIVGVPGGGLIGDTIAATGEVVTLLADLGQAADAADAVPHWEISRAQRLIHVQDRMQCPQRGIRIETITGELFNAMALPEEIRRGVGGSAAGGAVAAVWIGGELASVCYTGWQTETLCDIAVFTQPRHRGKGHAAAAASCLIRHIRSRGRLACWFTDEDNPASLSLAGKLGFRVSERVALFRKPICRGEQGNGERQAKDSRKTPHSGPHHGHDPDHSQRRGRPGRQGVSGRGQRTHP